MLKSLGLILILLWGFLSNIAGATSPAEEAYQRALEAAKRGDVATGLREMRAAAQQGYAKAQVELGHLYMEGYGKEVPKDYAEALRWYHKAAAQGHPYAAGRIGQKYEDGQGVPQDDAEALRWYHKAAEYGDLELQFKLAEGYERGRMGPQGQGRAVADNRAVKRFVMPQDLTEAHRWYSKLVESLHPGPDRNAAIEQQQRVARQLPPGQPPAPALPPSPSVGGSGTQSPSRRALVIGNAAYTDSPLANPVHDAVDMAAILRRVGFDVTLRQNADKAAMERAVEAFTQAAPRGSAGLFFFAGHGVQLDGVNYLIPVGAVFQTPVDVRTRAVSADWVLGHLEDSAMDVKLLILDACRNNPLGRTWQRGGTRGLAPMDATKGTFIAYATSPGKTAADGTPGSRNSPYTAHLLRELTVPGRSIHDVFEAVRAGVLVATRGQQLPWETTALIGKFYFAR